MKLFTGAVAALVLIGNFSTAAAQATTPRVVRLAEIEIDPHQIAPYSAALREEIEASVRLEPGVLSLSAVSIKGHPEQVRVFEVYADDAAYQKHLQSAHFKRYKAATGGMVKALHLVETDPIVVGTK